MTEREDSLIYKLTCCPSVFHFYKILFSIEIVSKNVTLLYYKEKLLLSEIEIF